MNKLYTGTVHELGFGGCSHKHFTLVDHFVSDRILKSVSHANLPYKFITCARETPVGSTMREYHFTVEIGGISCPFFFKVEDVKHEITYARFNPQEINDVNDCKRKLNNAHTEYETSGLRPLFDDEDDEKVDTGVNNSETKESHNEYDMYEGMGYGNYGNFDDEMMYGQVHHTNQKGKYDDYDLAGIFDEPESQHTEEIIGGKEMHFRNQKVAPQPDNKEPDEDNTPTTTHKINPDDERPLDIGRSGFKVGGWANCSPRNLVHVKQMLAHFAAMEILKGITTYKENITSCKTQVVEGINYKIELTFNSETCVSGSPRTFTAITTSARATRPLRSVPRISPIATSEITLKLSPINYIIL